MCKKKKTNNPRLTHNTCSFDSIFHLYAACYLDLSKFKEYADKNSTSEFINLMKSFCDWEQIEAIFNQREILLHSTFHKKVIIRRKILELCYMSVIDMFIELCGKNNVLYSMAEEKRCPSCSNYSRTMKTSLPLSCVNFNIGNFNHSIRLKSQSKHCDKCNVGMNMEIQRTLSPVVIVDLDGMQNSNVPIGKIQQCLVLDGKKYRLYGLIKITGNHFIAHALRSDGLWHTYDDLHPNSSKIIPDSSLLHPVLLMYCLIESDCDSPSFQTSEIMKSKRLVVRLSKYE